MEKIKCSICGAERGLAFRGPHLLCQDCIRLLGYDFENYWAVYSVKIARKLEKLECLVCDSIIIGDATSTLDFLPKFSVLVYNNGDSVLGGPSPQLYVDDVKMVIHDVREECDAGWPLGWEIINSMTPLRDIKSLSIFDGCESIAIRLVEDYMHRLGLGVATTKKYVNCYNTSIAGTECELLWEFTKGSGVHLWGSTGVELAFARSMENTVMEALFSCARIPEPTSGNSTVKTLNLDV